MAKVPSLPTAPFTAAGLRALGITRRQEVDGHTRDLATRDIITIEGVQVTTRSAPRSIWAACSNAATPSRHSTRSGGATV